MHARRPSRDVGQSRTPRDRRRRYPDREGISGSVKMGPVARLYRHPIVIFGLGPAYLFILQCRVPLGLMRAGWQPWLSTMGTNLAIAALVATVIWFMGVRAFVLVELPITLLGASIGVWLFYIQHQFEDTLWAHDESWNRHEVALHGSSHYDLPGILRWFTANIGVHHVHHLCSRIPYYRLPWVLRDHPELGATGRLTFFGTRVGVGSSRSAICVSIARMLSRFVRD